MTITSSRFANSDNTAVEIQTAEIGAVIVSLEDEPDSSGGWREVYQSWEGNTLPCDDPAPMETVEEFVARNGYSVFALLDLSDIEGKLTLASIEKPPKATAVRSWIDQTRLAFATGQPAQPAPYTYQEVAAEVLALLQP